ncbi:HD domain-containing protein [Hippea maritima]|uniref:Metal-dependent phosphohydrolase HD sub domain protein n=1 Tax=Hippea maritima (strain ATCC 700847 / DSM 10411 / MH2) TaxID=760142 RepID=F2LXC2_HIPMA|nr:HD domain-containing protein [Hippea maritima]AEA34236.1 metal-dependent phosphohydrolase HD sub domain protein [Hippea maritima DSM 10411]
MDVNRVLFELSRLSDSIEGNDTFHQRRVTIIAHSIASELGLEEFGLDLLVKAALIHDIALLNDTSKVETFRQIVYEDFKKLNRHSLLSGRVARFFNLHLDVTTAITLHHTPSNSNSSVLGSILFLADNIEVAYRSLTNPYAFDELFDFLSQKKELFDGEMLTAFEKLSKRDCFWFNLLEENVDKSVLKILDGLKGQKVDDKFKTAVAYFLAYISDNISPFFDGYSILTKNIAISLGYKLDLDIKTLQFASLVSHVGNLIIPFDVFSLPSLDSETYNIIKSHTYQADWMLRGLGFNDEAQIVAMHHENYIKDGYPCRKEPMLESAVVGLSSFVAAMMQDRPYRESLDDEEIKVQIRGFKNKYPDYLLEALVEVDLNRIRKTKDEYYEAVKRLFI